MTVLLCIIRFVLIIDFIHIYYRRSVIIHVHIQNVITLYIVYSQGYVNITFYVMLT